MFPQDKPATTSATGELTPQEQLNQEFIADAKSQFSTLLSEVADRNRRVQENDSYIYGDLLERMLDIPVGHDMTPINWLRRTVEIHRTQFMGHGFSIDSTYNSQDINNVPNDPQTGQPDPNEVQRLVIENEKAKSYAEARRLTLEAIFRDNDGDAFWSTAAENASAVGDTVVKVWFDEEKKKMVLQQVEAIENFYALWSRDDYRHHDAVAYIQQISKEESARLYNTPLDTPTSPLGYPLAVLTSANIMRYVSTQPMVTVMEISGKIPGWCSKNGVVNRCKLGQETEMNVILVSNRIYQLIDEPKKLPKYYIFPNKRQRRRPWGMPDVSKAAIQLNLTYIETLSDWRTLASKVNFPKWKAFGFAPGVALPKPKARTVEALPLAAGQDLQPLEQPNSAGLGEQDFIRQLNTIESQFVREVGISRQLFDMPDENSNSNQAMLTSMKSVSDLTDAKRRLWEPIITKMCQDILTILGDYDESIKELVQSDDDWNMKVNWPSALNKDDPAYHAMQINMFNAGLMSIQTYLENTGYDKQEIDRIKEEMEDKTLAAIHGHILAELAQYKIIPFGTPLPPKVNVNFRADATPEQAGNLAYQRGFNSGPFGTTMGPQGNEGLAATDRTNNAGMENNPKPGPTAIAMTPNGTSTDMNQAAAAAGQQAGQSGFQPGQGLPAPATNLPQPINTGGSSHGHGVMSQPGSGATATSAKGKTEQHKQRHGG